MAALSYHLLLVLLGLSHIKRAIAFQPLVFPCNIGKIRPRFSTHNHINGPFRAQTTCTNISYHNNEGDDIITDREARISSRRMVLASSLMSGGVLLTQQGDISMAFESRDMNNNNVQLKWVKSPINPKRSNFQMTDAEKIYSVSFVTYLSRFLLSFDPNAQQWWRDRAKEIPKSASEDEIFALREKQFAQFAASVEVGLQQDDFVGNKINVKNDGPKILLQNLLDQFGPELLDEKEITEENNSRSMRERKEARRQIALLFALLDESQPTKEITSLLAAIDNGSVDSVVLSDDTTQLQGFSPEDEIVVEFPLPQAGSGYRQAIGKALLKTTGRLLRIDVIDGGEGYAHRPDIRLPNVAKGGETAMIEPIIKNGKLQSVNVLDNGSGYSFEKVLEERIRSELSVGATPATIRIVPEMELTSIQIEEGGNGYAVEKPLKVMVSQNNEGKEPRMIGRAYPKGKMGSFIAGRRPGENDIRNFERKLDGESTTTDDMVDNVVSGASSGGSLPPLPFPEKASSSQQLLALLPQGYGLEYDAKQRRYNLAVNKEYQRLYPTAVTFLQASNRPLVPDFGPRGRSPIERDQEIDLSTFLRFCLSGAICASGVHLALTPLDVVKTKVQIDPVRYPSFWSSFETVWKEDGPGAYFTGWLPTVTGHFTAGGILYATTELIRRSLTEYYSNNPALEAPIILISAAISSSIAACLFCPFDAVRIRTVSQEPEDDGTTKNAYDTALCMIDEEGIKSLFNAIPVFIARQVPYAAVKFTVFDLSTEYLYNLYPLAQEDLKLSLGVSLLGGVFAGIGAAIVSNPADAVITELKKQKSESSPQEALKALLDRAGISALFKGLSIRMVFYSLNASFQFLVFDGVKFALGIGPDDLRLYLDVLGEAIATRTTNT